MVSHKVVWHTDTPMPVQALGRTALSATPPDRQLLNPKAKAWTPTATALGPTAQGVIGRMAGDWSQEIAEPAPQLMRTVRQQINLSVSTVRASLKNNNFVARVDTVKGLNFWTISVRMDPAHFNQHKDAVLAAGRAALVRSVQQSGCTYLMGYRTMPFVEVPFGFVAILGGMADPTQACWSTFETGSCQQKLEGCPWQHPVCRTVINVTVKLVDEP